MIKYVSITEKTMKPKRHFYSQSNYLLFRTAIVREQKQFIQIAFAVHLSAVIPAERYRSDSATLKSAVSVFVYFYSVLMVHKCQQSAAQSCSRTFELRVLPFGKTSGAKLLNFISCHLSDVFPLLEGSGKTMAFENRRGKYKEIGKKVPQAYRVYVEDTFLPCDAVIARIFVNVELDTETGLYYYGARYLDQRYSRWLSGDPAVNDYMAGSSVGEDGKTEAEQKEKQKWVIAHEVGHFMYLDDMYEERKYPDGSRKTSPKETWDKNIMAEFWGKVEEKNIGDILKKNRVKIIEE